MSNWNPVIPARYANTEYEHVPESVRALFESMINTRKGIFMHGDVGTGKTHIAYALHKNAPKAKMRTRFWNTVELFRDIREEISRDRYAKEHPVEKCLEWEGILILDDVGVEKTTDFVVESFYLIVNKRYNDMLPMIITSNYSLDALADKVGDRIVSRIAESCTVVPLMGADRRVTR